MLELDGLQTTHATGWFSAFTGKKACFPHKLPHGAQATIRPWDVSTVRRGRTFQQLTEWVPAAAHFVVDGSRSFWITNFKHFVHVFPRKLLAKGHHGILELLRS